MLQINPKTTQQSDQKSVKYIQTNKYLYPQKKKQQIIDELRFILKIKRKNKKIINLLDKKLNQLSKFRSKNCVEINDDACGTYRKKQSN